jgi:succinate dehydrogenase / fumarate reductase cytochrome b subunit
MRLASNRGRVGPVGDEGDMVASLESISPKGAAPAVARASGTHFAMDQSSPRVPKYYRGGFWERMGEGLRYGGGVGQWSWLIHRFTGLGVLLFLVIHIIDTFLVVAFPAEYDFTVAIYGGRLAGTYYWPLRWAFRIGELGLIASVLFHSINGVRIVLFDFWPGAAKYQKELFNAVAVIFFGIMIPLTIWVIRPLMSDPEPQPIPNLPAVGEGGTMMPINAR